jgi:hypothetical protein
LAGWIIAVMNATAVTALEVPRWLPEPAWNLIASRDVHVPDRTR